MTDSQLATILAAAVQSAGIPCPICLVNKSEQPLAMEGDQDVEGAVGAMFCPHCDLEVRIIAYMRGGRD